VGGIGANASLKPENVTSFTMNLYDSENKISKSNPIKSLTCGKCQLRYATGYDVLSLYTVDCPYSTATRYELVTYLILWEVLQVV